VYDNNIVHKKSAKEIIFDNFEEEQLSSIVVPETVKKLSSVTYISPLQQEYTERGLETESDQRHIIDIRLL